MRKASNTLKRIVALVAAFAMALALVPLRAFAADGDAPAATTYTITVTSQDNADHTYGAYQIFTGKYDSTKGNLSNVEWGANITDGNALIAALQADDTFKDDSGANIFANAKTAEDVADALNNITNDSAKAQEFAKVVEDKLSGDPAATGTASAANKTATIAGLADGYYLVKDTADVAADKGTVTRLMLQVVGDVTVNAKNSDVPTVEKKVKDTNDTTGETSNWQDSADYDIGDSVPFQLTGTVPAGAANYDVYKYAFHDVMSAGLTFNNDVAVTVDGAAVPAEEYTVSTTNQDGCTFEVTFANAKKYAGKSIVVTYSGTLNTDAVVGIPGNPNKAQLEYSNNPNNGGEGTNKTPWDHVIVFTYKTVVNKTDGNQPLTGADFKLEKEVKQADGTTKWVEVTNKVTSEDGTSFTFKGLDDGNYKITETKTPAGYNSIDPITFTITAEHVTGFDGLDWTTGKSGDTQTLTSVDFGTLTHDGNDPVGTANTTVVNKSGSTLPSTGGMGVLPFVLVGCGIAVAAGIGLHVARSRREDA